MAPPVLVLRALGLGDGLTAVPALRGVRRLHPERLLVLATAHPVARLLHRAGVVDRVLPVRGLGDPPPGLALGRHLAVNLHGRGPQSHRMLLAGRPDRLLAHACEQVWPATGQAGTAPAWQDEGHEVDRWCRLVDAAAAAEGAPSVCDPTDLVLDPHALPDPDQLLDRRATLPGCATRPVVLHPGASTAARRWPAHRWAAVARHLVADGLPVVVTGSATETGLVSAVVSAAGLPPAADLAGRLDLDGLAALVARARLLLSGDTGVAHLATALRTRSVTVFGPVPPSAWGPRVHPDRHRVLWHAPDAHPDGGPGSRGLLRVTVAEVVTAAHDQFAAATSSVVCGPPARVGHLQADPRPTIAGGPRG